MQKSIGILKSKNRDKSVHGAPNGRKVAPDCSAHGAIWRLRVPHREKKDRRLMIEQVITHASRPKGLANKYSRPAETQHMLLRIWRMIMAVGTLFLRDTV